MAQGFLCVMLLEKDHPDCSAWPFDFLISGYFVLSSHSSFGLCANLESVFLIIGNIRPHAASPATGSFTRYLEEQARVVEEALK